MPFCWPPALLTNDFVLQCEDMLTITVVEKHRSLCWSYDCLVFLLERYRWQQPTNEDSLHVARPRSLHNNTIRGNHSQGRNSKTCCRVCDKRLQLGFYVRVTNHFVMPIRTDTSTAAVVKLTNLIQENSPGNSKCTSKRRHLDDNATLYIISDEYKILYL
jgi:hypothetical protein